MIDTTAIPDPEQDFEGCLSALADAYVEAVRDLTPRQREDFHLHSSAAHLARMIELKAPDCMVDLAERTLMRRLRKRRAARRSAGPDLAPLSV